MVEQQAQIESVRSELQLSRMLQGGQGDEYQRAGETKPTPLGTERVQTIDVSFATIGHSYISDSPAILLEERGDNFISAPSGGGNWILQEQ